MTRLTDCEWDDDDEDEDGLSDFRRIVWNCAALIVFALAVGVLVWGCNRYRAQPSAKPQAQSQAEVQANCRAEFDLSARGPEL